jgi:hypothetical protein
MHSFHGFRAETAPTLETKGPPIDNRWRLGGYIVFIEFERKCQYQSLFHNLTGTSFR